MDENTLNRIESKIDRLDIRIDGIDMALALQGQILEEHQRRSLANEELIAIVRKEIDPLKTHVAMWAGGGKSFAVVVGLVAIATFVLKLLGKV